MSKEVQDVKENSQDVTRSKTTRLMSKMSKNIQELSKISENLQVKPKSSQKVKCDILQDVKRCHRMSKINVRRYNKQGYALKN